MFEDFEDFLNNLNGRSEKSDEIRKFIEKMMNRKESLNDNKESELGEPSLVTRFKKNGYTFEKTEWENEYGKIVKVEIVNTPFETSGIEKEITLEKELELAVAEERYEDAARIRDEIKNEKNSISDIIDNENINTDDVWNF
jgi:metal-responsive CopG/Arc/MetJ family transcriptional regulator